MNYRFFTSILLMLVTVAISVSARENRIYSFGPNAGPRFVITTPEQDNPAAVHQLEALVKNLSERPPKTGISIIITANDFSVLPENIRTGYPEGTNSVISMLKEGESGAVVILLPGKEGTVLVRNGAKGGTSPRWLLEKVTGCLNRHQIPLTLEEYRMPLYRIGWMPENPLLAAYIHADVPALILETGTDLTAALRDLVYSFDTGIPAQNDRHYLVEKTGNSFVFFSEEMMVLVMIIASAVILLFLFIFSFLFGKKSEQQLRDLFHVWWLPFLYLAINIVSLYLGQSLISFLFRFRFGNSAAWQLVPRLAFAGKLVLAWFFITLVISFNQMIRFPEDSFIYGYIASITCMINIFVFSSLDFSLSPIFLAAYIISFIAYHIRHPAGQIVGILCMILPFYPYFAALVSGGTESITQLYTGADFWNIRMALFIMPFQLMISRFFHTVGVFGRRHHFYVPVNPVVVFILAFTVTGTVLFIPAWSPKQPLPVQVRQTIDKTGNHVVTTAPVTFGNLDLEPDPSKAAYPSIQPTPISFVRVTASSRKFIERQLAELSIEPVIPVQKIEVTITSANGIAVYDASQPFELLKAGQECRFVSGENPETPYAFSFSSGRDADLTVTIHLWTRTNPYGLVIRNRDIKTDYLLEIVRTVQFSGALAEDNDK